MTKPIETYISNNQQTVNKWLISLFGRYICICLLETERENQVVSGYQVCQDARRLNKLIEVLEHYNLLERIIIVHSHKTYSRSWYKDKTYFLLNHKVFRTFAKKYGVKFKYNTEAAPAESKNRIDGYPAIENISHTGLIHWYFNQNKYELYDRVEEAPTSIYSSRFQKSIRKIRIYPKNLIVQSEKEVFAKIIKNYYATYLEEAIKVLYGFKPEVLTSLDGNYISIDGEEPKVMAVRRVNQLELQSINKEYIKEKLTSAHKLLKYAEAAVRDLEKLATKVPKRNQIFMKKLQEEGEIDLLNKAPMMMASDDPTIKDVATLLLRGSNKGII